MRNDFYWIAGPWVGRLAIIPRPRGGDWLEDEIRHWQQSGLDVVISLLTPNEEADLDLNNEKKLCLKYGMQFYSFPISDRGTPSSLKETMILLKKLEKALEEGKTVAVHCRQGIGRSAMIAASLLIASGIDVEDAFHAISEARGYAVPDTVQQREWAKKLGTVLASEYSMAVIE
jgi:protein-tyrosine phosphatase